MAEFPQQPRDEAVARHSLTAGGSSTDRRDRSIDDGGLGGSEMDHHACLVCYEACRSTVLPCRHQLLCSVCVARLNPARKLSQCSSRCENQALPRALSSRLLPAHTSLTLLACVFMHGCEMVTLCARVWRRLPTVPGRIRAGGSHPCRGGPSSHEFLCCRCGSEKAFLLRCEGQ